MNASLHDLASALRPRPPAFCGAVLFSLARSGGEKDRAPFFIWLRRRLSFSRIRAAAKPRVSTFITGVPSVRVNTRMEEMHGQSA